jgi:hypothetical protein
MELPKELTCGDVTADWTSVGRPRQIATQHERIALLHSESNARAELQTDAVTIETSIALKVGQSRPRSKKPTV